MPKSVQIITPYKMQWLKGYQKVFKEGGYAGSITDVPQPDMNPDVMIFMWCDANTIKYINTQPKRCKYIVFVRRYELFAFKMQSVDWDKVDKVVMVNDALAEQFKEITGITPEVIYNGVLPEDWTFRKHHHGKKVAVVGYVNMKKNLPLALQIMAMLDDGYELHIAGAIQDASVMLYLVELAKSLQIENVTFHGHVEPENMDKWLEDKDYLLSTALSEGCPNNVIEAMAKGIKPIVHAWPGAEKQFNGSTFGFVGEAVNMIRTESDYQSEYYQIKAAKGFGYGNYVKVKELVDGLML